MKWLPKAFNIIFSTEFIKILTVDVTATLHLSKRWTKMILSILVWFFYKAFRARSLVHSHAPWQEVGPSRGWVSRPHGLVLPLFLSGSQFPHYKIKRSDKMSLKLRLFQNRMMLFFLNSLPEQHTAFVLTHSLGEAGTPCSFGGDFCSQDIPSYL